MQFGTPYEEHLHIGRQGDAAALYLNLRHNQKVVLLSLKINSGSLSCALSNGGTTGLLYSNLRYRHYSTAVLPGHCTVQ